MNESVVKNVLIKTIKELEESGDIVIVNPTKNSIANRLHAAVQEVSPNLLAPKELGGIINALNAHNLGFGLDENDFQSIAGLTKEELKNAVSKLNSTEW